MPPDILDGSYRLPVSDGSGRDRATLRSALTLLSQAGYDLDGTVLRQRSTKAPLSFEILVTTRDQERIALAYLRDLKRAGIEATVRSVDAVQFDQRRLGFDFDMIPNRWDQSLSPGNEQWFYWGSEAADHQGTRNYMGAKGPRHRRHDRGGAGGARASRLRLGGSGAGPDPDVGLLRYPAV